MTYIENHPCDTCDMDTTCTELDYKLCCKRCMWEQRKRGVKRDCDVCRNLGEEWEDA